MPSNLIKVILSIIGLSPALLLLYLVKLYKEWAQLSIYFSLKSFDKAIVGGKELLRMHCFLLIFIAMVLLAGFIIRFAGRKFSVGRIEAKTIKPSDNNFNTVIFSIIPAVIKFSNPGINDGTILIIFVTLGTLMGLTMKGSYHHNIVLKLLFRYRHYEVQETKGGTYLVVSKRYLINPAELTQYVRLADHMLLDIVKNKNRTDA